eukprot:391106-Pelagomonas_calceolata.AAC.2
MFICAPFFSCDGNQEGRRRHPRTFYQELGGMFRQALIGKEGKGMKGEERKGKKGKERKLSRKGQGRAA